MSEFKLGVVTNTWGALLPASSLEAECERAKPRGLTYVELRQRALGGYEETVPADSRPWPLPGPLAELRRRIPDLGFNLAAEAPFLARVVLSYEPYVERCAEAASALGGAPPVLRLVDLTPATSLLDHEEAIDELGHGIAELCRGLWKRGVALALENSSQPVAALRAVLRRAAFSLPAGVPAPRICWDPVNQYLQRLAPEDPLETARSLQPAELFEFHFKQARGGTIIGDVQDGDVDWRAILAALHYQGHAGPALFEIAAGPDAWERIDRSADYVRGLLTGVGAGA